MNQSDIRQYGYPLAFSLDQGGKIIQEKELNIDCPKIKSYEVIQSGLDKILHILEQEIQELKSKLVIWMREGADKRTEYYVYFLLEDPKDTGKYVHGYNPNEGLSIKTDTSGGKSIFSSAISGFNRAFPSREEAEKYFHSNFELSIGRTNESEGNIFILKNT